MKIKLCLIFLTIIFVCGGCSFSTVGFKYESAQVEFEKGNYNDAKSDIEEVLKSKPDKAEYLIMAGHISVKLKEFDKAIQYFDKAIIKEAKKVIDLENNKESYRGKGISYLEEGKYEEAISAFDEALKISDGIMLNKDILTYKADAMFSAGKYDEVIEFIDINFDGITENTNVLILKAKAYAKLKNMDMMLKCMDRAASLGGKDISYHKATCYEEAGDYVNAQKFYEEMLNNNEANKEAVTFGLANCLIKQNNYAKALEYIGTYANDENCKNIKLFKRQEIVLYEKMGNYKEAYAKAQVYMSAYPDDEEIKKEMLFIETRITE